MKGPRGWEDDRMTVTEPHASPATHQSATHEVTNQPPPLVGHDVAQDAALLEGLAREGADWKVVGIYVD